jgi:hypothetical protein
MLVHAVMILSVAGSHLAPPNTTSRCSVRILRENPTYEYTADQVRETLNEAEVVVRAVAIGPERLTWPSASLRTPSDGSGVAFRVLETLRGSAVEARLVLPGYLVDEDDFNEGTFPYGMVRRSGQRGDCYAMEYRLGGEYLLLLNEVRDVLITHWKPLAPVNEQVTGTSDPWLAWVREHVGG